MNIGTNWKRSLLAGFSVVAMALPTWAKPAKEFIVKYKDRTAASALMMGSFSVGGGSQLQVMDQHEDGAFFTVKVAEATRVKTLARLIADPNVEYVVPNFQVRSFLQASNNDVQLRDQWHIATIKAKEAWQKVNNRGKRTVTVAVIDTGVDYRHKSLAPNMVQGYDFARNDNDPDDTTSSQNPGHGTHCAGLVGASGLITNGTIGVSPEVSIMPLRFLDERGSGNIDNGIKAIDYAISKKVDIISASWGAAISREQAKPLLEAIQRAEAAGILFVAAAANDGKDNDTSDYYPTNAGFSNVISVAASARGDTKPRWSNFGRHSVDLSSPGENIMSTVPKDNYSVLSGTSMATPIVSGLAALVKAQDPSLKPTQIRSLLQATATKVAIETACDCRVDALSAVETVMERKMFVSPFAATLAKGATQSFEAVYGDGPFKFVSSNANIATITDAGVMTALTEGETTVSVTDSKGKTATSYKIYVGKGAGGGNPPPDNPGQPGDCPLGDQALCDAICQVFPSAPFCKK